MIRVRLSVSTVSYVRRKINELNEKGGLQSMPLVYSSRRSVATTFFLDHKTSHARAVYGQYRRVLGAQSGMRSPGDAIGSN